MATSNPEIYGSLDKLVKMDGRRSTTHVLVPPKLADRSFEFWFGLESARDTMCTRNTAGSPPCLGSPGSLPMDFGIMMHAYQ